VPASRLKEREIMMSGSGSNRGPDTEQLRCKVDDLATNWIVSESRPAPEVLRELSAAFAAAREQAEAAGMPDAARIAATLAGTVAGAAEDTSADLMRLNEALNKGLADLEHAMEAGEAAAPPPAAEVPAAQPQAAAPEKPAAAAPAVAPAPAADIAHDPELLNDVILESGEHLASVENELLNLERDASNQEAIHTIFRSFHTIKGLAGFLELTEIQKVAHHTETLLDDARNGKLHITSAVADVILASKDYLERAFQQLSGVLNGSAPQPFADNRALIERIGQAAKAQPEAATVPGAEAPPAGAAPTPAAAPSPAATPSLATAPSPASAPSPAPAQDGTPAREADTSQNARTDARTVKVDTAKLDYLVDMIGELVIAQSQVRHDPGLAAVENPRLQRNLAQLTRTTAELQRTGMAMRMVPVGHMFRRMVRLVRDLARKAGKLAEVEIIGEDTELDRTIVEELADPLVHMIRNSMDHGLEGPEERKAAGKDPNGKVKLRASHQAGHILIEIADDGRGIDRQKVLAKAKQRGLVAEGAHIPDSEILNLIFEPGFSTAEKVTDISGRGVGMDVVRKQVQKLRGRIEIQSTPGEGTTFLLKLPLTLAIIDGLVVGVGRERYIVPLFAVRETFRPTPEMLSTVCGRGEMALIRGQLLPVARLYRRFGVKPRTEDPCDAVFIVAENGGRIFCLMVDEFIGKQEVVLKSLGESLKNIAGVAGGAILGDGRVGLVLDLDGINEKSNE
jgi:two-component system chemotaxis sensor kinase CheA